MKMKVFSLFDVKAANFGTPFFMLNEAMAIRAFTDLVNDPNSSCSRHPADFILYCIGDFDDSSSVLESVKPISLMVGSGVRKFVVPRRSPADLIGMEEVVGEAVKAIQNKECH